MMNQNLRRVLDQFAAEGLDGDWHAILELAHKELADLQDAQDKLLDLEENENATLSQWTDE